MKPASIPTLLTILSLPALVQAAPQNKGPARRPALPPAADLSELLKSFDKNGNHQIDADEAAAVQKAFAELKKLDKNANGEIEQGEITAATAPATRPGAPGRLARAAEGLKRVDKNGNHRIDPDEIPELEKMMARAPGEMMKKLDQNGNGKLEEGEVARLNERIEKGMGAGRRGTPGTSGTPGFRRPPDKPAEKPAEKPAVEKKPEETIKPAEKANGKATGDAAKQKQEARAIEFGT
ncbi:MAG: hypothetical protein K1X78_09995 [Verrucomicrobiaceae bacterium]|nr:hypothetical protein [Verrucomicrobiaceae bacterium]